MSNNFTWLGLVAGTLTTVAFVPQVVRVVKTRSTSDLSLGMVGMTFAGVALWLVYGALMGDAALVMANSVTVVLVGIILFFKLRLG